MTVVELCLIQSAPRWPNDNIYVNAVQLLFLSALNAFFTTHNPGLPGYLSYTNFPKELHEFWCFDIHVDSK